MKNRKSERYIKHSKSLANLMQEEEDPKADIHKAKVDKIANLFKYVHRVSTGMSRKKVHQ